MIKLLPHIEPDQYIFSSLPSLPISIKPLMMFQEKEGTTYILKLSDAEALGIEYAQKWSWISLGYHSDLEMTGLTAAISKILGDEKIPCNIVAAFHHDHIFVPFDKAQRACSLINVVEL